MPDVDVLTREVREHLETMTAGNAAAGADLFHDPFLSLDPTSVAVVDRAQLRAAEPARERMFASAGASAPRLEQVETTVLDDQHVLARTRWTLTVTTPGEKPLILESTYLLRRDGSGWTTVVYLNHHDVRQLVSGG